MRKLYTPFSYTEASCEELAKVCNGCGAKDGMKFPGVMWGLSIVDACNIHDWMFHVGVTQGDFEFANNMFDHNLRMIIKAESNWFMRPLRLARADKYSYGVEKFGESAYWVETKVRDDRMSITIIGEFR